MNESPVWTAAAAIGPLAAVAALGVEDGGYFPVSWGWSAVALATAGALAVVARRELSLDQVGLAWLAITTAFVAWSATSLAWSISAPRTVLEVERGLVYASGTALFLLLARSRAALLVGALAGVTFVCIDALALYGAHGIDRFEGTLLFRPVGYANGLGALAAIGLAIAIGLPAAGRPVAAAAASPLGAVLVLTESRGAWLALALGLLVAVALSSQRIAVAAAAAPTLVAAAVGGSSAAVAGSAAPWLLTLLGATALAAAWWTRRGPTVDGRVVLTLAAVVAGAGVAVVATHGTALRDRPAYWRAALSAYRDAPVAGSGAGTFALDWLTQRRTAVATRDAHSLELESLAELGPVGLGLALALLAVPLAVGARRREDPLVPAAAAGFAVLAVHSALDWDWEQPAVWLAGTACAVVLVTGHNSIRASTVARLGAAAALLVVALLASAGLRGNALAERARRLLATDPPAAATTAHAARSWQPWASEPLFLEGRAELALGRPQLAAGLLARAVSRDRHDPQLWRTLAVVSPPSVARVALDTADRLDPFGAGTP